MKPKTDLETRTEINKAIANRKLPIYRCLDCDNLSVDNKNWAIYINIPDLPNELHYTFSKCIYCRSQNYGKKSLND